MMLTIRNMLIITALRIMLLVVIAAIWPETKSSQILLAIAMTALVSDAFWTYPRRPKQLSTDDLQRCYGDAKVYSTKHYRNVYEHIGVQGNQIIAGYHFASLERPQFINMENVYIHENESLVAEYHRHAPDKLRHDIAERKNPKPTHPRPEPTPAPPRRI